MAVPIVKPRVRETSTTTGTGDITLLGPMRGSLAFDEVMAVGESCDICISYDNSFEECEVTLQGDGTLLRGTVYQSRHANDVIDTNHVSFAAGVKTVIMVFGSSRLKDFFMGAVRFDEAQSLSDPEQRQALDNLGLFPTGTTMLFVQAAVPAGWTLDTTHDDKALRIVDSVGGGSAGSSPFSTVFGKTATDGHSLTQAQLPNVNFTVNIPSGQGSHTHTYVRSNIVGGQKPANAGTSPFDASVSDNVGNSTLPAMSGTAASGGSGTAHTHPMDIRVNYVDSIIGIKD